MACNKFSHIFPFSKMNENKTFWIRYGKNRPVKIHTHFHADGTQRGMSLSDVADLIEAFLSEPERRKIIGLPENVTLHIGINRINCR